MPRIHDWKVATAATTSTTPLDIASVTPPAEDFHGFVRAKFIGRSAAASVWRERVAAIRRVGGGSVVVFGSVATLFDSAELALATVGTSIVVSGDDVVARVTGLAATAIDWKVDLQVEVYL